MDPIYKNENFVKEYYLVIINGLKKQFTICENKEEFINEYYEVYLKFKFVNVNQVEITSNLYQNENLSFALRMLLEVAKNMLSFIIKKHQIFKLKRAINFEEDYKYQIRHNRVISYLYKDEWFDFPNIDSIIKKITG